MVDNKVKMKFFDVSLRDGIQARKFISNTIKMNVLDKIIKSGIKSLEVTSFSKLPQFERREDFIQRLPTVKGVTYFGLVANKKGYELFKQQSKIKGLSLLASANDEFTIKNVGKTSQQLFHDTMSIVKQSNNELADVKNRVYISCSFGYKQPYETNVSTYILLDIVDQLVDHGVNDIVVSDTTGLADQKSVEVLCNNLEYYKKSISFHFHGVNSIDNVSQAYLMGYDSFDASVVDGYCPASGAKEGNVNLIQLAKKYAHINQIDYKYLDDAKELIDGESRLYNHWGYQ